MAESQDTGPGGAYDDTAASVLDFHHSMLVDRIRTESFLKAILGAVTPGDVVVDIGAGTGVLSMFAARAGARRVFAIEQGPVAKLARRIVAVNGFEDRVTVIEEDSRDVELPEPADVLVTETIGNAGLEEGIVAWVDDARARFLKPDATVIPALVSVEAALVEVRRDYAEIDRWAKPLMGLDFTPLRAATVNNMLWGEFSLANLLSPPQPLLYADFVAGSYRGNVTSRMAARRDGVAHGLGVWFDAQLFGALHVSNRPPTVVPSWQQGFLPLTTPLALETGQEVEVSLEVAGDGSDWIWRVGSGTAPMSTMNGRLDGSAAV